MTSLFNRWLPCTTLAVWSTVLLATYGTGRVNAFLHPNFRPGVLIAGIVLAALALLIASRPTPPECCVDATCTHPLSRSRSGRWFTFLILILPVSIAAWLSPENFSKKLIENRGIATDITALIPQREPTAPQAPASPTAPSDPTATAPATNAPSTLPAESSDKPAPADYLIRTPEGYIVTELLDLLYSVQDMQLRKDFEGKTVQLIAQAMPAPKTGDVQNRFKAVRMFMTCCAADAKPIATLVQFDDAASVPEMSWVKIIGTATFPIENGKRISLLQASSVQPTTPPEESMLFQ